MHSTKRMPKRLSVSSRTHGHSIRARELATAGSTVPCSTTFATACPGMMPPATYTFSSTFADAYGDYHDYNDLQRQQLLHVRKQQQ